MYRGRKADGQQSLEFHGELFGRAEAYGENTNEEGQYVTRQALNRPGLLSINESRLTFCLLQ